MVIFNIVCNTLRPFRQLTNFQGNNIKLEATRTYVRWASRRPVAIINEDELYETEDTTQEIAPVRETPRISRKKKSPVQTKKAATEEKQNSRFTSLKHDDKIISSLMSKVKSRKLLEKNNEIILEGQRLIKEGLKAGVEPTAIFFNDPSDIKALKIPEGVKLYKIPYKAIQLWSNLTSSPGLIGIFKTPDVCKREPVSDSLPLTIICDNVRDPGNLGSIMRAAAAVGCEKLILMKGCVDLWNQKVVRSAAGTHFRLPIQTSAMWDEIPSLISNESNIFVADSNFGDEYIPNYDSHLLKASLGVFNVKPSILKVNIDNTDENARQESNVPINKATMKEFLLNLPIVPYYSLDYTEQEIVLILSGETEGVSSNACKFLRERQGIRINIPLLNGVDSLNTGVALGIVTFEMKRQFIRRQNEL